MANLSDYLEAALANHVFRNNAYTSPTAVYLAIFPSTKSTAELEAGNLTGEITAYDGDRPAVTFGAPAQTSGGAQVENTNQIEYQNMPAATVGYTAVMDAATAGNVLTWQPVVDGVGDPTTRTTEEGGILRLNAGNVRFRVS